ncbi:hypothetical protein GH5_07549 [Leishmania sp. Ghana 2012 LV757]|uniref:hypothetical protein n=1 Tax=Leishmania sp. Ghana 2012 LV757 TaxID=2803181 RepID=UPI001B6AA3FF|nr:hypothetical protein GH5_07549 [Leishmania sp. Ghana 2012 LV757]
MRAATRSPLFIAAVVVATALSLTSATGLSLPSAATPERADGPITVEQCFILNPRPAVTTCNAYLPPIVDLYGLLPYDTTPAYGKCVKERCLCTGAATSMNITTSGIFCNSSGWMESGYTTCNVFDDCFARFWYCINSALYTRFVNSRQSLSSAEVDLLTDITAHGSHPGEPFDITDTYRSCRLIMCAAASSRKNCGLVTCLPNYTQCDEYIHPPPLPYTYQLCTQGCRAVLLMMAMTIAVVAFSTCCFCCCPSQVRIREPVIMELQRKLELNSVWSRSDVREGQQRVGAQFS